MSEIEAQYTEISYKINNEDEKNQILLKSFLNERSRKKETE